MKARIYTGVYKSANLADQGAVQRLTKVIKVVLIWSLLMLEVPFMGDLHNSSSHYPVQYVIYVGGCLPCCQNSYI